MCTITGTLQTIVNDEANAGSIEVALCGFGSQVPRVNGEALTSRVTDDSVNVGTDGTFSFDVAGNDEIMPEGSTYYTVTVKDDNGDIVQVNAYQFLDGNDYDLNTTDPFDPSQLPPPQLPPLVLDLLLLVDYDPAAVFPGDSFTTWEITLAGDCTPSFEDLVDGNLYTVIVIQDGTGGHAFNWPANVINGAPIDSAADSITIQTFNAMDGNLYAIGAGTYWP